MSVTKNLTSTKGYNSVINEQKMTGNNPNLDLISINANLKFGESLLICHKKIELKHQPMAKTLLHICKK